MAFTPFPDLAAGYASTRNPPFAFPASRGGTNLRNRGAVQIETGG